MSSLVVVATSAGAVTIAASATAIATLAVAVGRRARHTAEVEIKRTQQEITLERSRSEAMAVVLTELAIKTTPEATELRERLRDFFLQEVRRNPRESEQLSKELRSVAHELEAEADKIAELGQG